METRTVRRNCGTLDRAVRLVLGIALLGLYGALDAPGRYFTLVGLPLIATALTGFCPFYTLCGISTVGHGSST